MNNLNRHKVLWLLTSLLALVASSAGVLYPAIYRNVISAEVLPGTISQDAMTIALSSIALILVIQLKASAAIQQIVVLGILGFYFYAYGIYVIERVYNPLYLVYMTIFGMSFYSLIYAIASLPKEIVANVALPDKMRKLSVGFSLLMPVVFYPLWISMLIPLMRSGEKIEFFYSIFIIDLCFIMPAFMILAVMSAKKKGLGILLTPALYIVGFAILFPLVLAELFKPLFFERPIDPAGLSLFFVLSLAFLIVAAVYLRLMEFRYSGHES